VFIISATSNDGAVTNAVEQSSSPTSRTANSPVTVSDSVPS